MGQPSDEGGASDRIVGRVGLASVDFGGVLVFKLAVVTVFKILASGVERVEDGDQPVDRARNGRAVVVP